MGSGSKDGEEAQHHTDTATTSSRRVIPRWLFRADRSLLGRMKTRANPAAELEHAVNDRQSHVEQGAPHSPGFGRPTKSIPEPWLAILIASQAAQTSSTRA